MQISNKTSTTQYCHHCIVSINSLWPGNTISSLTLWTLLTFLYWDSPLVLSGNFINSLRPRRYRRHFADDIFKCIFLNENEWMSLRISLKFVPKVQINNIPSLVQIMAWRRPGDKPLSEPMMVSLLTHICVTRPQWVNWTNAEQDLVS